MPTLLAIRSSDNTARGQAEAAFNQAKSNPDLLISALVHLLRNNQQEQARASWATLPFIARCWTACDHCMHVNRGRYDRCVRYCYASA